jgi:hypothetical protein
MGTLILEQPAHLAIRLLHSHGVEKALLIACEDGQVLLYGVATEAFERLG